MNGPDLAREIRRTHPGVPVLLMSGDTGHVVDPKELDARGFLQKPFSARTLVTRVEELLTAARAKAAPPTDR
jgi:DNA-binding response OmpR family regulator